MSRPDPPSLSRGVEDGAEGSEKESLAPGNRVAIRLSSATCKQQAMEEDVTEKKQLQYENGYLDQM